MRMTIYVTTGEPPPEKGAFRVEAADASHRSVKHMRSAARSFAKWLHNKGASGYVDVLLDELLNRRDRVKQAIADTPRPPGYPATFDDEEGP